MGNPTSRTTEENWKSFKSASHQAIIKHVPTTTSKTKRNLPWITGNIKCEIRKKDRQYRKAKKHEDWSAYRIKRQHLQKLMRSAHDDYIRNVIGASLVDRGHQKKCWCFWCCWCWCLNRTENVGIFSDTNGLHTTNQAMAVFKQAVYVSLHQWWW